MPGKCPSQQKKIKKITTILFCGQIILNCHQKGHAPSPIAGVKPVVKALVDTLHNVRILQYYNC